MLLSRFCITVKLTIMPTIDYIKTCIFSSYSNINCCAHINIMGKVKIQRNMRRNNPKPFGSNIFYVKSHSIKNLNSKEENSNLSTKPSINDSSHSTRLNRLFLSSSKKDNSLRNLRTLEDLESLWDLAESIYSTKLSMSELLDKLYITRHDVNEKITALKISMVKFLMFLFNHVTKMPNYTL